MGLFHILPSCILSSLIFSVGVAHKTPAYSHDSSSSLDNPDWMRWVDGHRRINTLSLPGTHESLALGYGGDIAQCQTLTLATQLQSGIRGFDIRCRHIDDRFAIHHGLVYQHMNFDQVLQEMTQFLQTNPSEVLLMRLKEEYKPSNITRTFEQTFQFYLTKFPGSFWDSGSFFENRTLQGEFPTLDQLRGKILLLDDFSRTTLNGFNYRDPNDFDIEDEYELHTNWDLYSKWVSVKRQLIKADASVSSVDKFYITYLSGSGGSFPYFVASGHELRGTGSHRLPTGFTTTPGMKNFYPDFPRVDCILGWCTIAFEGTNVLSYQLINGNYLKRVGLVMIDFPGDGLIQSLIALNHRNMENTSHGSSYLSLVLVFIGIFATFGFCCFKMIVFYTRGSNNDALNGDRRGLINQTICGSTLDDQKLLFTPLVV